MIKDEPMPAFFEDDDAGDLLQSVDTDKTSQLSKLCKQMLLEESIISELEENLAEAKKRKQKLATEAIPSLFSEMGITSISVEDPYGRSQTVVMKPVISASISAERKEEAFAWLREHGYDDIIKNDVIVSFGKGEDRAAAVAYDTLVVSGFHPEQKTHVHPQTLKAFVRESLETGREINMEVLGAYVAQVATIQTRK